ncbi:MAG TPA: PIN domain-containing protein [Gemmatimonadota bacterium]|nr:PIN domain-containing protein [Gemmatimonadota bacterium]
MILIDTSVWVDFYRGSPRAAGVASLLEEDQVLIHPWIAGELALGHLGRRRDRVLADLQLLPAAPVISDDETMDFIERRRLYNRGIGWVDAQLLGSALLSDAGFWTLDKPAVRAAEALGLLSTP